MEIDFPNSLHREERSLQLFHRWICEISIIKLYVLRRDYRQYILYKNSRSYDFILYYINIITLY